MKRSPLSRAPSLVAGYLAPLLLLPLLVGCGAEQGTVSGRVLYQNKPVTGGWVMFAPTERGKSAVTTMIKEDGHYQLTVPPGEVRISVDNREWEPLTAPSPPPALPPDIKAPPVEKGKAPAPTPAPLHPGKYVAIPPLYYQLETSGLRYTVTAGAQSHDIELK
ncbi:MAG TPA: hypothetical protein VEL76_08595 [Gemmataceae bacterium]|nr:hypothetical protein [Gemmataceae bacterium]